MKFNIENYLYKLDNALIPKSKKDLYLIYMMIAAIAIGVSYVLFFTPSRQELVATHAKVTQIQKLIIADKVYLSVNSQVMLSNLDKKITSLKEKYLIYKNNNAYIKSQINKISFLFYNQKTWGKFLNSISINAKLYNVKLLKYNNIYIKHSTAFGHVLNINIQASGKYQNTLKFINSLEQSFLVVDVHNISMVAKNKLFTDLNLSVWGVRQ